MQTNGFGSIQILILPFTGCVPLDKLLNLSGLNSLINIMGKISATSQVVMGITLVNIS